MYKTFVKIRQLTLKWLSLCKSTLTAAVFFTFEVAQSISLRIFQYFKVFV